MYGSYGKAIYTLIVITITVVLVFSIGIERERKGYSAGLRTHILVAVGSCILMVVSKYGASEMDGTRDPLRLAAQVVTGIGFIGAGAIIQTGLDVKGLTTAATLWISAAIGLCTGSGLILEAIITTAIALFVLVLLKNFEIHTARNRSRLSYLVPAEQNTLSRVTDICDSLGLRIKDIDTRTEKHNGQNCTKVIITIHTFERADLGKLMDQINQQIKPVVMEEIK